MSHRYLKLAVACAALGLGACQDRGGGQSSSKQPTASKAADQASGAASSAAKQAEEQGKEAAASASSTAKQAGEQGKEAAASALTPGQKDVTGTLVRASNDEIVVRQSGGQPDLRLKVSSDTQVTVGGQQGSVSQLQEGAQVRASYDASGAEMKALKIESQGGTGSSQPGGSGTSPATSPSPGSSSSPSTGTGSQQQGTGSTTRTTQ